MSSWTSSFHSFNKANVLVPSNLCCFQSPFFILYYDQNWQSCTSNCKNWLFLFSAPRINKLISGQIKISKWLGKKWNISCTTEFELKCACIRPWGKKQKQKQKPVLPARLTQIFHSGRFFFKTFPKSCKMSWFFFFFFLFWPKSKNFSWKFLKISQNIFPKFFCKKCQIFSPKCLCFLGSFCYQK